MGCLKLDISSENQSPLRVVWKNPESQKPGVTNFLATKNLCVNYYAFGSEMPGRSFNSQDYRRGFNGMEKDDEVKGSGNSYTTLHRQYDARLGRWMSLDPAMAKYPAMSPYSAFGNSPISIVDENGDTLRVTTNKGKFLFDLDNGSTELTTITAKALYKKGTQWFSPTAEKYMPLISTSPNIHKMSELKHFTWGDIVKFSKENRSMLSYQQGWWGDWKSRSDGGDGYLLTEIDGMPYWTDAIGQIPFAIDKFTDQLTLHGDVEKAKAETIATGKKHGDGGAISPTADNSNSYDNKFIERAVNWAAKNYTTKKSKGRNKNANILVDKNISPESLGDPIK